MAIMILIDQNRVGRSRPIVTIVFCLVMGTFAVESHAQKCGTDANSPTATDRPQVTNSSVVVPCGSLQFENGLQVTDTAGQHAPDFPETSIRYGVALRTEVRISVPTYFQNSATASGANGFGDLSLGFKQQFGPIGGFDISLIPSASFPTGANSLSTHGYDPTVQLPWSRSLTKAWTVAGQLGVSWPTESGRHNLAGQASLYIDRQLTSPWDAYVEYAGAFPQRGGPQHLIDFGTAYKLARHQQLDLHCRFGLSSAASDFSIGFGYSVRFQEIRQFAPHTR